jgi:hypothetical protein
MGRNLKHILNKQFLIVYYYTSLKLHGTFYHYYYTYIYITCATSHHATQYRKPFQRLLMHRKVSFASVLVAEGGHIYNTNIVKHCIFFPKPCRVFI